MNRHSFRIVWFVVLVIGLGGAAYAQDGPACSTATLRGAWGYTETGSVIAPTGAVLTAAAVGRYAFDNAGNFEGEQNSSVAGAVGHDTKVGTYVINPDCTGTLTLTAYRNDVPQRFTVWAFVLVDNGQEMRAIITSMAMITPAGNVTLSPIMTMTAKKVVPGRSNRD